VRWLIDVARAAAAAAAAAVGGASPLALTFA